jgi:hypothetical protein
MGMTAAGELGIRSGPEWAMRLRKERVLNVASDERGRCSPSGKRTDESKMRG